MGATYFKGLFTKLIPSSGIEFSDGRIKTYASGSPEGVITATVGSEYTDTSSGILYQKRSGSGNTGWVATISLTEMATGSMSAPGLPFVGDANTGIFQPNVNRLGITTDGQERFMVDENGRLYNVYDGDVGTNYRTTLHAGWMCRAWVNFDGTGAVAIRASGNVSTISDNGTGDYTLNFTVALPDANYCTTGLTSLTGNIRNIISINGLNRLYSTTQVRILTVDASAVDMDIVSVGVFR